MEKVENEKEDSENVHFNPISFFIVFIQELHKEIAFLKEKCKLYEEKIEDLSKENRVFSENLSKLQEELELYKSVFLVKNLEVKFQHKKENLLKNLTQKNLFLKSPFPEEKSPNLANFNLKERKIIEENDKNCEIQEQKLKAVNKNDPFLGSFLNLYEKFGVRYF